MIQDYVSDLANQMGIKITKVSITGGPTVSCVDYRLEISSKSHVVNTFIHETDLESINSGSCSGFVELKIRAALDRLRIQMAP